MSRDVCYELRDELVWVLRRVSMSQQSCANVGMRSEYTWKCMKLWRCQGMHKRCEHVQGHMIIKVMCQIGMQEHGGSVCMGMVGQRMRAWVTTWKGKVVTITILVTVSIKFWTMSQLCYTHHDHMQWEYQYRSFMITVWLHWSFPSTPSTH